MCHTWVSKQMAKEENGQEKQNNGTARRQIRRQITYLQTKVDVGRVKAVVDC